MVAGLSGMAHHDESNCLSRPRPPRSPTYISSNCFLALSLQSSLHASPPSSHRLTHPPSFTNSLCFLPPFTLLPPPSFATSLHSSLHLLPPSLPPSLPSSPPIPLLSKRYWSGPRVAPQVHQSLSPVDTYLPPPLISHLKNGRLYLCIRKQVAE